jgi:hypothetical protein
MMTSVSRQQQPEEQKVRFAAHSPLNTASISVRQCVLAVVGAVVATVCVNAIAVYVMMHKQVL